MVSDASFHSICLILCFDWARMSFFPSLTLSLFPFKQVHHLGQAQSLARSFSAMENEHVCYELLSKNKHLVSTDYSLFCFVIALLNPYSHNSLLSSFPSAWLWLCPIPPLLLFYFTVSYLSFSFIMTVVPSFLPFIPFYSRLSVSLEYNINLIVNIIKILYWIVYRSIVLAELYCRADWCRTQYGETKPL
jgi:hypothetical protein